MSAGEGDMDETPMRKPEAPQRSRFGRALRWALLLQGVLLVLLLIAWVLFTKRDHTLVSVAFPEDALRLEVVANRSLVGDARLYLVAREERLGEAQRLYLRSWDAPLKELGTPRLERTGRSSFRVAWSLNLIDERSLALRSLQSAPEGASR